MPSQDQMLRDQRQMPDFLRSIAKKEDGDLAAEIAALRRDIADLRAALVPVPSLIATGREVLDEFKRLKG